MQSKMDMENYLPVILSSCLLLVGSINLAWGHKLSLTPFGQGQSCSDGSETKAAQTKTVGHPDKRGLRPIADHGAKRQESTLSSSTLEDLRSRGASCRPLPSETFSPMERESASALRGPTLRSQLLCALWAIVSLPYSAPQRISSFIREMCQRAKVVGELNHSCAPSSPPLRGSYSAATQQQLGGNEMKWNHLLLHPLNAKPPSPEIP